MLDAMESLGANVQDPMVAQYMMANLQAWRALQEQMRAWGVVSNNHASFISSHVGYRAVPQVFKVRDANPVAQCGS